MGFYLCDGRLDRLGLPAADVLGLKIAVEFASVWEFRGPRERERERDIEKRDRERERARGSERGKEGRKQEGSQFTSTLVVK